MYMCIGHTSSNEHTMNIERVHSSKLLIHFFSALGVRDCMCVRAFSLVVYTQPKHAIIRQPQDMHPMLI